MVVQPQTALQAQQSCPGLFSASSLEALPRMALGNKRFRSNMESEPIEPMTHTEDTFKTATGETLVIRHYTYRYPDIIYHLYDLILETPRGYQSIYRSTETEIPENKS